MNQTARLVAVLIGVFLVAVSFATAGIPRLISYGARLTNSSGSPVTDTVSMTFTVYRGATGDTVLWTETHPAVAVINGLFSVMLGSVNFIPDTDTISVDSSDYLGVKIGGDPEISPRTHLVSVPYALRANFVVGYDRGLKNVTSGRYSFIAGDSNTVTGDYCSITGGYGNLAIGDYSLIGGGWANVAGSDLPYGDTSDIIDVKESLGLSNPHYDTRGLAGGGHRQTPTGAYVGGGVDNHADADYSAVCAGYGNHAGMLFNNLQYGQYAFVGGGQQNYATRNAATVAGGSLNLAQGNYSTISGGRFNAANC
jgi:hypothetical protein